MISLNATFVAGPLLLLINLLYAAVLLFALYRAPWSKLTANLALQHLCFGATVALIVIWSIRAELSMGVSIHLLGMTVLCLVLGWGLAIVCASVALVLTGLATGGHWSSFAVNAVLTILLPVALTQLMMWWATQKMVKNFFIYLFFCGFFGAGLSAVLVGLSVSAALWLGDIAPWWQIQQDIITIIILTVFPEALLNGMLLSAIMVFYPDWIRSFDAKSYIDDQ